MESIAIAFLFAALAVLLAWVRQMQKRINLLERDVTYLLRECYQIELDYQHGGGQLRKSGTDELQ